MEARGLMRRVLGKCVLLSLVVHAGSWRIIGRFVGLLVGPEGVLGCPWTLLVDPWSVLSCSGEGHWEPWGISLGRFWVFYGNL